MSFASVSIVGNLVRDPEPYQFENSGRVKTSMVVAVNGYNKVKKEKTAEFYKVETWDRLGELANNYLRKGSQVAVTGKLSLDRWTDRNGNSRCTPVVSASQLALPPKSKPAENCNQMRAPAVEPSDMSASSPNGGGSKTESVISHSSMSVEQLSSEAVTPEMQEKLLQEIDEEQENQATGEARACA